MSTPEALAATLDESVRTSSDWHEVASQVRELGTPDDETRALAAAFDYMLQVRRRRSDADQGRAFEPMFRFEGGEAVPPDVENVPPAWLEVWEAASHDADEAVARARLHDLLQEASHGDVPAHASEAVHAYLELSNNAWHPLERSDALIRALEISRKFQFDSQAEAVVAEILGFAERALDEPDPKPGIVLSGLHAVVTDSACPDDVDVLLSRARDQFEGAHLTESIIELQRMRAAGDRVRQSELDEDRVEAWLDEAARASGLVKVVHLETALRLAEDLGVPRLREVAQRRLQDVPSEDLELALVSSEVEIPPDVVEEYLSPFTSAEDVGELLAATIAHPPATGQTPDNDAAVERSRTEFPLQHLFPRVHLGGDGLPRWQAESDADKRDEDLAREETLRFQVTGELLARGLFLGGESVAPEPEATSAFLRQLPNVTDDVVTALTDSLHAYWDQRWTEAGFLALPCVEALSRNLLLRLDVGLYNAQRGQRPGRYPPLASLLRWLEERGLDESWYRYVWTLLCSPAGMNLRNEIAHGFVLRLGPPHAAAILHISLFLASLDVRKGEADDVDDADDADQHNS